MGIYPGKIQFIKIKGEGLKMLEWKRLLKWVIDRTKKISPNLNYAVITGNRKENELILNIV